MAESLSLPLIVVRYEGVIGSFLGETAGRLRRLFDQVRTRQCVLFFDEFDTLGKERGDIHDTGEVKRVVSSLLLQIDDLPSHVVVVTATNHPELLDRAVWRRFQLRLSLPMPTRQQVELWLERLHARFGKPLGMNPKTIAEKLNGLSFAELEDFSLDLARKFVLSLGEGDPKDVVRQTVQQWATRFKT
jgi:AAA+ superfamily predicted ATPase